MISFSDDTVIMFPPFELKYIKGCENTLEPISRHIDCSKSGVLLDNTTLWTAYQVLMSNGDVPILPHYLFDLGIVLTAISFFDKVYFISCGLQEDWQDFFAEFVRDHDDAVFVHIPFSSWASHGALQWHFNDIFKSIGHFFSQSPVAVKAFQDSWEVILGIRPQRPKLWETERLLDSPKHFLQQFVDTWIRLGYSNRLSDGNLIQLDDDRDLDQYCTFSTSRALFYSVLAKELRIPYIANSLRGASLLAIPVISADRNWQLLDDHLDLMHRIKKQLNIQIEELELTREITRLPLALSAVFNHKIANPQETLLDCVIWLREITKGYRLSIDKYLSAAVRRDDCGIEEVELARGILNDDFTHLTKHTKHSGLILKIAGFLVESFTGYPVVGDLIDFIMEVSGQESLDRLFLRMYRPYLHTILSLRDTAKECLDLHPVYSQVFGKEYPERFLDFFERVSELQPIAGF